uniref:Uncharacterized protein n=1 Tax=Anopheles minimus TaxID=112268 RepID=A0A182VX85_9DIPT
MQFRGPALNGTHVLIIHRTSNHTTTLLHQFTPARLNDLRGEIVQHLNDAILSSLVGGQIEQEVNPLPHLHKASRQHQAQLRNGLNDSFVELDVGAEQSQPVSDPDAKQVAVLITQVGHKIDYVWGQKCDVAGRVRSSPMMFRTSSNTFCCISGCFARFCIRKLIAEVVVSWPSNMNVSTSSRISRSVNGCPSTFDWSNMSKNAIFFLIPKSFSLWSSALVFPASNSLRRFLMTLSVYPCNTFNASNCLRRFEEKR